jgi:hypothetical protein
VVDVFALAPRRGAAVLFLSVVAYHGTASEFEGFGSVHIFASSSVTRFCGRVPIHGRSRALPWLHLRMDEVPVLTRSGHTLRS